MILIAAIENHKNPEIDALIAEYLKRLQPLHAVSLSLLPSARVNSSEQQQIKETEALLKLAKPGDTLFLLDETGKQTNSLEFSNLITQSLNQSRGKIIFCIGGAYGFTAEAKLKFPKLKMSDWVFPIKLPDWSWWSKFIDPSISLKGLATITNNNFNATIVPI